MAHTESRATLPGTLATQPVGNDEQVSQTMYGGKLRVRIQHQALDATVIG